MRTQMLTVALAFVALFVAQSAASEVGFQNVGFFNVSNPAFFLNTPFQLNLAEETSSLLISSFTGNPFEQGAIYLVENVTAYYEDFSAVKPVSLGLTFQWPNAISSLPQAAQEQLGVTNAFIVPDGFLVPGKDNGGLYIVDQKKLSTPYRITPTSAADADNNFFFHSAVWVDIDGDGLLDVLSAHAAKPLFGETKTGLVWYKQPAEGLAALPWAETLITEGPDVFFAAFELDNDNTTLEVVATEFFSKQLSLNVISLGGDKPGSLLYRRVIDTTLGAAYHVDVVGLTSSGTAQLLVTNHESSPSLSGVYAYDIPSDLKKGTFERHTLANGFKVTEGGFNQATPGFAYAIHPEVNATGVPHILVAGDGSQSAYLMNPNAQDYSFDLQTVVDVQGTVGSLLITNDWNEDGLREFLVPDYDSNSVFVYSFTKTNAAGARRRAVQKL